MKQFDLEKAKAGKPVCTRDGRKARIICFNIKDESYPIIAAIAVDDREIVNSYTIDGKDYDNGSTLSGRDLMMACEAKEGWINIYEKGAMSIEGVAGCSQNVYETKENALNNSCTIGYIDTIKVMWEE